MRCHLCNKKRNYTPFGLKLHLKRMHNVYERVKEAPLDIEPYALIGEEPQGGQPNKKWRLPDLPKEFPRLDVSSFFVVGGDPVVQAERAVSAVFSLAAKLSRLEERLVVARGSADALEVNWRDGGFLVCRPITRREPYWKLKDAE